VTAVRRTIKPRERRPLVLVTDVEERASLAACRGLAEAGYGISGASAERPAPGHWSRSCSHRLRLPDPRVDQPGFVAGLELALRRTEHAVLLTGSDVSTFVVSEQRERLEPLTRIGLPDRVAVRASLDKVRLLEEARAAGLPAPPSVVCENGTDTRAAIRELGLPIVVKPRGSFLPDGQRFRQQRVALVEDEDSLADVLPSFGRPFVVQRFEERQQVVSCAGVMTPVGLLATIVVRWSRRWPPRAGATTFCQTIVPPSGLAERVERLLGALGYQGIFELELLERSYDRYAAIDLNPRVFGWLALALRAGVNLPALYCDWLFGRQVVPLTAPAGVRYRWEDGDVAHLLWQLRHGRPRAAASVLRPAAGTAHAYFALADPGPFLARGLLLARKRFRRSPRAQHPSEGEPQERRGPAQDRAGERLRAEPRAHDETHQWTETPGGGAADDVEPRDRRFETGA
jgi:predicted ATP-grasp superfamily ATP-dependent carboligase